MRKLYTIVSYKNGQMIAGAYTLEDLRKNVEWQSHGTRTIDKEGEHLITNDRFQLRLGRVVVRRG